MGKVNDVILEYLDDNERFADLFNGDFFHGEQVVQGGGFNGRFGGLHGKVSERD